MKIENYKKYIKPLAIGIVALLAVWFISFGANSLFPKEHPINSIHKIAADKISLSQAKNLFDLTYDDETGAYKPVEGKRIPGETGKMVQIFRKAEPTPENQFYLARMLLIHAYQPYFDKSQEANVADFQEGYALLTDLAAKGYEPSQFYIGKVTLTPESTGMFSEQFYNKIHLPRYSPGFTGSTQWCQRLHFTNSQKDQLLALISQEQTVELPNEKVKVYEYFRSLRALTAPKSNGYGLKYYEAIAYLDAAGRNGNPEGYRVLQDYFDSLLQKCPTLWEPREIVIIRWLSTKYKELL